MATNTINTRIKLRTATLTEWENNPQSVKIYKGEAALGLDTTNNKYIIKIGTSDNGSYWKDLSEDVTIPAGNVTGLGDNDYQLSGTSGSYEDKPCINLTLQSKRHGSNDAWSTVTNVPIILTGEYSASNPVALKDYVDQAVSDASTQYYEGVRGTSSTTGVAETDSEVISRVLGSTTVKSGSTFVIKTAIAGASKYEYIAFTYGKVGSTFAWNPMDGNYNAKNSYVDTAITDGKETPTTIISAGANLYKALQNLLTFTKNEIAALDVTDTAVDGQFVSSVSETDGKIAVTRRALTGNDLPDVSIDKLVAGTQNPTIPAALLPAYVDDVIEAANYAALPAEGETGKIYVTLDNNKTYRWSGTQYVEISASLALGETADTAYRGDRGKTAYDHATDSGKLTTAKTSKLYKISVTAQGHVGSVTEATAEDIPGLSSKTDKVSGTNDGNLAAFDDNGNLKNSGIYGPDVEDIINGFSDKVDRNANATQDNIAAFDDDGGATVDTGVSKAVLQSASSRTNDSDLGLISKAQLAKVTGNAQTDGTIAKAQATADSKVKFLGTTTTNIVSNPNVSTISISGNDVTANIGDVAIYSNTEYRYTSNGWKTIQNAEIGAQVNVIESIKVGGDDGTHPQKTFSITNKAASISAADMRAALNVADGAQVNVVEGAKDADGNSFTITNKNIMITDLVLNGGSATAEVSMS